MITIKAPDPELHNCCSETRRTNCMKRYLISGGSKNTHLKEFFSDNSKKIGGVKLKTIESTNFGGGVTVELNFSIGATAHNPGPPSRTATVFDVHTVLHTA